MAGEHSRKEQFTFFVKFIILLMLWFLLCWLIADATMQSRTREIIQVEGDAMNKQLGNAAHAIDYGLDYLHGIPALIAQDEKIALALAHFGSSAPSALSVEQRKTIWSRDALLMRIDNYLSRAGSSLGADVVWVTNASGDCIASSNSHKPESFVGTNYADRDYFRTAQKGKAGRQYAVGRKSNIPGLYFSSPIFLQGRFAGVAVAKIDLPKLSHWVNQSDAFIADEHGVIILAQNTALEMHALPNADIAQLSKAERLARYKRDDFPVLAITPWKSRLSPALHHFGQEQQPFLISSKSIKDEALELHALKPLPAVADYERNRLNLFLQIGTLGTLVLCIVTGLIFFADIRKRSELHSAQSASLLRATIESTDEGILVIDNERHVSAYNQRFIDLWHIPQELLASGKDDEILNYVFEQLEDPRTFMDRVMELYAHPELNSFDTLLFKNGTYIERYSSPQRLGQQIVGRVWSFRDVTEQKRAKQALRDSHDELEIKVRERTSELELSNLALHEEKLRQEGLIKQLSDVHQQLLQSEKMASIGQLAAGVAHEINNPVAYVNSNLTTLQVYLADMLKILSAYEQGEKETTAATQAKVSELKKKIDITFLREDIGKLISESVEGLQRVKSIVQDLKDFSHVGESEKQMANIEQGLDSTLNVVWNELKYKTEVIKEYGGIPEIECMPTQLNQVFMNLLINAAQAIEVHGRITLRTGQDGENVWVEVEDTGAGIDPQNMARIFEPFFTTKPVGKGTGLGLSMSYAIVQKHSGRIELRSELGKGSVFRVILPQRPLPA